MPASQEHITANTPPGAHLLADGVTFRVWAPGAKRVYVVLGGPRTYKPKDSDLLVKNDANGDWTGFVPGLTDGTKYRFFVVGDGGSGLKRDPRARELEFDGYPDCDCIVRDPDAYPWHDQEFRAPEFCDLIVYQFHVGVFYARDAEGNDIRQNRVAKLLDAIDRIEYLSALGVNALQPLPLVEFQTASSLGYNGTDFFSPEMDYCVDPAHLRPYLRKVNRLLALKDARPVTLAHLEGQVNQLKAFVDICHLFGLAVIVDVVYNHAGGNFDPQSIDYFDFPADPGPANSIYFSDQGLAGGRVFAFSKPKVQDFLIANAKMFLEEYHADGLRFDEVTVIDRDGGWFFCQNMTHALRDGKPGAVQIAEYWGDERWLAIWRPSTGMGFDIAYTDLLRDAVRRAVAQAAGGSGAPVNLAPIKSGLERPWNFPFAWQAYNCVENHDLVLDMDGGHRQPRIPRLADPGNARSWYARSRARVASGVLLTAPGIPMLFMGEEFLEDKLWSDSPGRQDLFLWWDGLEGKDPAMADFHRFMTDLLWLRRRHPALRSDPVNVFHIDEANRILAFHRWVEGVGRDVVVVASLRESPFTDQSYALGFPAPGRWYEVFNSDLYDHFMNPSVQGNFGGVQVGGPPLHGLPCSTGITIPANGILVFARDHGD